MQQDFAPMVTKANQDIIIPDQSNPYISSPHAEYDLFFYQTKNSIVDPELYRNFLKNAETRFRRSKEYKTYKARLMNMGFTNSQILGNIEASDTVDIELHHNVLGLFDICILISNHVINVIGRISTFDLIVLLIREHFADRVGVTFLDVTSHQQFTNDPEGYIPPNMTFGKWWELLDRYKYGITFDIAKKINRYINRYRKELPVSINLRQQEEILSFAYYNQYGMKPEEVVQSITGYQQVGLPYQEEGGDEYDFY